MRRQLIGLVLVVAVMGTGCHATLTTLHRKARAVAGFGIEAYTAYRATVATWYGRYEVVRATVAADCLEGGALAAKVCTTLGAGDEAVQAAWGAAQGVDAAAKDARAKLAAAEQEIIQNLLAMEKALAEADGG